MARPKTRPPINREVLQAARIRKGMTQEDVQRECIALGAAGGNVSRMESGATKWPHPRTTAALLEVLGLTIEELCAPPEQDTEDTEGGQQAA